MSSLLFGLEIYNKPQGQTRSTSGSKANFKVCLSHHISKGGCPTKREALTPHDDRHPGVNAAQREGTDVANERALVRDLSAHDDQGRIHDGVTVFEAHAAGPRPESYAGGERNGE